MKLILMLLIGLTIVSSLASAEEAGTTCYEIVGSWHSENGVVSPNTSSMFFKNKTVGDTIYTTRGNKGVLVSFNDKSYTFTFPKETVYKKAHYVIARVNQNSSCINRGDAFGRQYPDINALHDAVDRYSSFQDKHISRSSSINQ